MANGLQLPTVENVSKKATVGRRWPVGHRWFLYLTSYILQYNNFDVLTSVDKIFDIFGGYGNLVFKLLWSTYLLPSPNMVFVKKICT